MASDSVFAQFDLKVGRGQSAQKSCWNKMASKFWCCFVLMIAMRIANGAPQLKIQTDDPPKEPTFVEKHNKLLEWLNFFDDFSATSTTEAPASPG